ncbi:hypothetical protein [Micromonospora sp. LH3U1]|uniref:hypothetical protein n=1 Tax=Micromonospora sp. LH3U1 TaxID=3018339 RepID=UPI00234A7164|nr:hypothetical protein [Micromonospora sp. LH3U1]WCN83835.1 hypothetical protein PCA76_12700 [Micromonospora sp. LH3U1]
MTGVEMILAALAAGAGAGVSDSAKALVVDAYADLRDVLRQRLAGRNRAVEALDGVEVASGEWRTELGAALAEANADRDEEVLSAARAILSSADPRELGVSRYMADLREARGVQLGDHNVQHNSFN